MAYTQPENHEGQKRPSGAQFREIEVLHIKNRKYSLSYTVKPAVSGHSKIDKTKILMTNGSLIQVESIAECSPQSILQYF